ncbi:MAG: cytochrome c biogenesis CcdA family protein [Paracoccaceae bacterium]
MGFDVSYLGAAAAGLASFLTPCILPIVPFYLCYISGLTFEDLTQTNKDGASAPRSGRVVLSALLFSAGMIIVFVGLGAAASTFGQQIRAYSEELRWAAAAIILLLGLHYLGVFRIGFLMREAKFDLGDNPLGRGLGLAGPLLIGMAFAFGWTPCAGPILALILFQAADAGSVTQGALLLLAYGIGMTLPFVIAALFVGPFLAWAKGIRRHLPTIEKGIGVMLVLFAVLIGTNSVNEIANFMLTVAPDLGLIQ